jgi:hypothetical protein
MPTLTRPRCLHRTYGGGRLHAGPHRVQSASASSTCGSTDPQVGPYPTEVLYGILQQPKKANPQSDAQNSEQTPPHNFEVTGWLNQPSSGLDESNQEFLRKLKSDEKARYSWKVIAGKLDKPEPDVKIMWNYLKTRLS